MSARPTNRERFRVVSGVHAELEAAGVVIDIGQLDWACREVEQRLYEASLNDQYRYERARHPAVETPLGDQIEGE